MSTNEKSTHRWCWFPGCLEEAYAGLAFCPTHTKISIKKKVLYNKTGQQSVPDHAKDYPDGPPPTTPDPGERITHIGLSLTDEDIFALGQMLGGVQYIPNTDAHDHRRFLTVGGKIHAAILRAQNGKI